MRCLLRTTPHLAQVVTTQTSIDFPEPWVSLWVEVLVCKQIAISITFL